MTSDNASEIFPIVDSDGNTIGKATRGECHNGSMLLHPVVHLHLFNSRGDLYLQRRPDWKDIQPGKWDTAVGGHIDYGEDTTDAIRREIREELGLTGLTLTKITSYIFQSAREREYVNVYTAVSDVKPVPSDELDGGRFWSRQEIEQSMGRGIFTPNFENEYRTVVLPFLNE
jgi:hypothetical protein